MKRKSFIRFFCVKTYSFVSPEKLIDDPLKTSVRTQVYACKKIRPFKNLFTIPQTYIKSTSLIITSKPEIRKKYLFNDNY